MKSDRDLCGFVGLRVEDVMKPAVTIPPWATLADAERIFEERAFNLLPVVDGERMLGVLSKLDLMKAFAFTNGAMVPPYADIMRRPVGQYMNTAPFTVDPGMPITRALQRMVDTSCKSLPVVEENRLVGIVAREDVLKAVRGNAAGRDPEGIRASRGVA